MRMMVANPRRKVIWRMEGRRGHGGEGGEGEGRREREAGHEEREG